VFLEQLPLCGVFFVSSSEDAALPERWVSSWSARWRLGRLALVTEEARDL
jgi:hypothetical protein